MMQKSILSAALLSMALAAGCAQRAASTQNAGVVETTPARQSAGKPAAPVDLDFELDSEPQVGRVLTIELRFTPEVESPALRASFVAGPGLALASGAGEASFANVTAGARYTHRISVMPGSSGELRLHVIAQLDLENAPNVRTFTIPVKVGGADVARKARPAAVDSTGQRIEPLPAATVER